MFQGPVFGKSLVTTSHAELGIISGYLKSLPVVCVEGFHC